MTPQHLAAFIDHTKLTFSAQENVSQESKEQAILNLCTEAREYGFKAVCIRPAFIPLAKQALADSPILVATVVGFPHSKQLLKEEKKQPSIGSLPFEEKFEECRQALLDEADEIDFVMNVAQFKSDDREKKQETLEEFRKIRTLCGRMPVKVIIETDLLSPAEIRQATLFCAEAEVAMVKTSTGMLEGGLGACAEVVSLIQETLADFAGFRPNAPRLGIKASGGIKTRPQVEAFIMAGATRIGTSSGVTILSEEKL
ncbi:MAG: deoxyribose-phosphate aldolase [Vampirovibrionales bacterium]|nr:deoxyribose-phosphate aldolase [Vampirovibrionales bacterium]